MSISLAAWPCWIQTKRRWTSLREHLRTYPKVIIFTRYVDTLNYLAQQIGDDKRYADVTVITIDGSMNERKRREQFFAFSASRSRSSTSAPW